MKKLILLFTLLLLFSCKKNEQTKESRISTKEENHTSTNNDIDPAKSDTLKITYEEHKNMFDILTIIPDSTMESWEWKREERIELVKKVKKNKYIISTPNYLWRFSLTTPNTLHINVVDGSWILSIYKVKANNYIVITDEIVGDGNTFHAFEYVNGELIPIDFKDLFDHFITELILDPNDEKCMEIFQDNQIGFEYTFIDTKKIKMTNSSLEDNDGCFKGKTLNYEFNPGAKKFNLISIQ